MGRRQATSSHIGPRNAADFSPFVRGRSLFSQPRNYVVSWPKRSRAVLAFGPGKRDSSEARI